jgi:hypothetical protein
MSNAQSNNPLDMLQGMWNQMGFQLPGMVTPTLDEGELDKQIRDLKSVENWLRMNLSMLQMTIQNLEMQKSALGTFRSMSDHFNQSTEKATETPAQAAPFNAFFQAMNAAAPTPEQPASPPEAPADEAALAKAAMWPWEMMNELNATVQAQLADTNRQTGSRKPRAPAAKKAAKKPVARKTKATRAKAG